MADMMTFPNTVEEFMEQYKITDTEQIYTNGAELVPIFRMKQWFDHKPEIIHCKECENWDMSWGIDYAPNHHYCHLVDGMRRGDFYCADAGRRTNEQTD